MFTGLVQGLGEITSVEAQSDACVFKIQTSLDLAKEQIGASIACSGVCLTATDLSQHSFTVQTSPETMRLTTAKNWQVGTVINLEPSLRVGDPMGGHLVTGHVDGLAVVEKITPQDGYYHVRFTAEPAILKYIAYKGSVTVEGVSLTVNAADNHGFEVMLIPHTWKVTTLGQLKINTQVNIEIDILARYVARAREFA